MSAHQRENSRLHHCLTGANAGSVVWCPQDTGRKVAGYGKAALVEDATPRVSLKGRERCQTAGANGGHRRSVHAFLWGKLLELLDHDPAGAAGWFGYSGYYPVRITYSPMPDRPAYFQYCEGPKAGEEWTGSKLVGISGGQVWELVA